MGLRPAVTGGITGPPRPRCLKDTEFQSSATPLDPPFHADSDGSGSAFLAGCLGCWSKDQTWSSETY